MMKSKSVLPKRDTTLESARISSDELLEVYLRPILNSIHAQIEELQKDVRFIYKYLKVKNDATDKNNKIHP